MNINITKQEFDHLKRIYEFEMSAFGYVRTPEVTSKINKYGNDFFKYDYIHYQYPKAQYKPQNLPDVKLRERNGYIIFESRFNRDIINNLKSNIPAFLRRWEPETKKWFIDISYKDVLLNILNNHANINYTKEKDYPGTITKDIKFEYIDNVTFNKVRFENSNYNYEGYNCYFRNILLFFILKEAAYEYFKNNPIGKEEKIHQLNYYEMLGLSKFCKDTDLMKTNFKKSLFKHHPDHGGTVENFIRVKNAYETLTDPRKRKKYNLGLKFADQKTQHQSEYDAWEPTLNNGSLSVEGFYYLGYLVVNKINNWDYIYNNNKQKLITKFNSYTNKYETEWK